MTKKLGKLKLECPACLVDLTKGGVSYIEDGCYNEFRYELNEKKEWVETSENNGEDATETYYTCTQCGETLPDELQEYFGDNI